MSPKHFYAQVNIVAATSTRDSYMGRVGHDLGLRKRQGRPTSPPRTHTRISSLQILFVYKGLNKLFVAIKLSNFVFHPHRKTRNVCIPVNMCWTYHMFFCRVVL